MADWHSVWLTLCEDDLAFFDAIVRRLGAQFGTQSFIPHLTLVEDMQRPADELAAVLATNFAGESAFSCPISEVRGLPAFFRSLFVAFEPSGRLLDLKSRAVESFRTGDVASFMPHISLAYGASEDQKTDVLEQLKNALVGRMVRFDAIAVVASAQSVPIEDWTIVHRHRLL